MVQSFNFTFRILKNTKGFISSMIIMPIVMIALISITLAYSKIPTVGYIGNNPPKINGIKYSKVDESDKDYFLGMGRGTLVIKTDEKGNVLKYYSSIKNNPLINFFENKNSSEKYFQEQPKISYSIGIILFKLFTAGSLLATFLIQERSNGLITRIKNSKVKLHLYILGKALAIFFIYEIANIIMLLFYKYAGFDFGNSDIIDVGIIFSLTTFISINFYVFFASILKNEGYIWSISTGIIFPLGLFSGMLFPTEYMANWMKTISKLSPLYYLQNSIISGTINYNAIIIIFIISILLSSIGIKKFDMKK